MKRMLKRSLALLLSLMLLAGMLPMAAFATEPAGNIQGHVAITGGALDSNNLGTLDLKVCADPSGPEDNPLGATVIWFVFSFDNTVIVPYNTRTDKPMTGITDGDIASTTCFTADYNGIARTGARWSVKGNRSAVIVTYNTTDNDYGTLIETLSTIGKFHYTLAEGKTAADIKKGTFKIETDYSEGSFLKALKDDEPQAIHIQIKNGPSLGYADGANPDSLALDSFTYPGIENVTLDTLAIASDGDAASVAVPKVLGDDATTTAATLALTATAVDTEGDAMNVPSDAAWSLADGAPEGVTISGSGASATLSVAPGAKAGTATVKVASGDVTATKDIEIARDTAAAAVIKVFGDDTEITGDADTIVIPPQSASAPKTKTYAAKAFNQYGEEMSDTVNLTFATADANVTYADGTVSVTKDAEKTNTYTLTAALGGVTKTVTISLTDLAVNWAAVDSAMKSTMVYGTPNSGAANLPATGTATAGGTLNGRFEILNPAGIQPVGDRTVTVRFTVTDSGDYQNITVDKPYTVAVTKRPVTVKADDKTIEYGTDFGPDLFTLTITSGSLVADDTEEALCVVPAPDRETEPRVGTPVPIINICEDVSANYEVTFVPGKFNFTKTNIKKAGFLMDNPEDPDGPPIFETKMPHFVLASDAENSEEFLNEVFKDMICQDLTATVLFGGSGSEEDGYFDDLPVNWTGPAGTYNPKGATYTYTGTIITEPNFNPCNTRLTATMTVVPVTGTPTVALETPVVVTKSVAENAQDYMAFGLPDSITIQCSHDETDVRGEVQDIELNDLEWSVPLNTLKAKPVNSTTPVTVKLPADLNWLTIDERDFTVEVKITDKFPVNVTVTPPSDITYGGTLGDPAAVQAPINNGTDPSNTFTYQYTGTTEAGQAYDSDEKPTEAGDYTVTATLVSDTHAGSGSATFSIAPKALTDSMIAAIPNETYNKEAHEPVLTVTDGTALTLGTDYTVTYENNVNAGTATAKITGKGNYTGTASKTFTIDKASLAALKPVISGTAQVGKVLTANLEGVADSELTYQWKRGGTDIPGATRKTYLLAADDSNKAITVVITAKGSGNYTGSTLESEAVTVEKQAISGTVTITEANTTGTAGTIDEGDTLTAVTTGITPAATFTYQWYRGEEAIASATNATYTVTDADAGAVLKVVITAGGDFQGEVEATVEVGKAVLTGTPTITGASSPAAVGDELTASFATGTAGTDYTVVWLRDGEPIPGAEGTTYTLTAEDQGKTVSVKLVGMGTYTGEVVSAGVTVPAGAPAKPVLNLSAGSGELTASWAKPADNGAAILSYTLTITDGADYSDSVTLSPDDTSHRFTGLQNGTTYTVTLKAANSEGDSPADTKTASPKIPVVIGGGGAGGSGDTEPVVTPGADGSTVSTVTEEDGTVTTTTTWPDGKESVATVTPDGDVTVTVMKDGDLVTSVKIPAVIPDKGKKYQDVPADSWFEENVYKTTNLGLFAGTTATTFSPKTNLNRGMLVTALYRLSGNPAFGTDENIFPDVEPGQWYADASNWANAMGVAAGTGTGFEPKKDITRQDMVTLIYRYAKAIGLNPTESASLAKFKDGAKTSDYAQTAMKWAVSVGIISGKGEGILDPRGNATRAEVATVLAKFVKYLQK